MMSLLQHQQRQTRLQRDDMATRGGKAMPKHQQQQREPREQEPTDKTSSANSTAPTTSKKAVFRPFENISIMNPDRVKSTTAAERSSTATSSSPKPNFERSADFGRFFNSNGSPSATLGMSSPFLSKDSSYLPSMDDVFKSKDSFPSSGAGIGGMFSSKDWTMDFTRKFSSGLDGGGDSTTQLDDDSDVDSVDNEKTKKMPEDMEIDNADADSVAADFDSKTEEETSTDVGETTLSRHVDSTATSHLKSADWVGTLGNHVELPPGAYTPVQMGWYSDIRDSSSSSSSAEGKSSNAELAGRTLNSADWFHREFCDSMGTPRGSLGLSPYTSTSSATTNHPQVAVAPLPPVPVATANDITGPTQEDMKEPPALAEEPNIPTEARAIKEVAEKKSNPKPKRKRSPRKKIVPDVKEYVEPRRDIDVLLGRGGRSNHFPGNKRYREEVNNLRKWYNGLTDKDRKTELSGCLIDFVKDYGGRFLELDKEVNKWYIVPDIVARRKASQALREDDDPEKRRAKRQRFLEKKRRLAAGAAAAAATTEAEAASAIKSGRKEP